MGTTMVRMRTVASLLLLAQLCAADRYILQTVMNCSTVHPSCVSCSVKRTSTNGLVGNSELICKGCTSPGYQLNDTANTCGCAPGYFTQPNATSVCEGCPKDSWCPGGLGAAAGQNLCGTCLMTRTPLAQNTSACITQPGCGYQPDGSGTACPIGTYSSGNNQQPCTPCPAGLTTVTASSESIAACMAPAGYFFQAMQALPCPKGTFKVSVDKAPSCTPCQSGLSTAGVASTTAAACDRAMPGYRPVEVNGTIVEVEPCPVGSYGPDGLRCIDCTNSLTTQTYARTTPADCLAGPGYGYYPAGKGDNQPITTDDIVAANSKVVKCPNRAYKAGWNLEPCKSCGVNVLTDTTYYDGLGLSVDQCFIAPGYGAAYASDSKQLVAYKCNNGSYGVAERTFGVEPRPCKPCPANTVTPDQITSNGAPSPAGGNFYIAAMSNTLTSSDQCSTLPGYGWEDGVSVPCPIGYFAPGYDNQACNACGQGLTTTGPMSRRIADCIALPGWEKKTPFDTYAVPCPVGSYSAGGNSTCQKCPLGSSTQYTASYAASQCGVCAPGWGFDTAANACAICNPGSFSPGGSDGPCIPCGDKETSATGSSSSDDCFKEFMPIAPYDMAETPVSAWTKFPANTTANITISALECLEACRAEARCQYWLFRAKQDDPANDGCTLKLAPVNYAPDTYTAFKLGVGDYTIYEAADDEYQMWEMGVQPWSSPDGMPADPWKCLHGCDKEASCRGVYITKVDASWACWFVRGAFGLGSSACSIKANPPTSTHTTGALHLQTHPM